MAETVENNLNYGPGGQREGWPRFRDDMSISLGPRPLSDTIQPETTPPSIGNLGEALLAAMKETIK
jgi:hypothetical protein